MKKKYLIAFLAVLMALLLTACGSGGEVSSDDSGPEQAEQAEETASSADPYAWLGLQDMPECNYLDIVSANHYIRTVNEYVDGMSYVSETTNAADGINTLEEDSEKITVTVDGVTTVINKSAGTYVENDMSDTAESAKNELESAMASGTDTSGRSYNGTGSGAIPVYGDQAGDTAEYEYYEYHYPDSETNGDTYIERFYMKDGDVFAIYHYYDWGGTVIESTEVIKSISSDIPEGTFSIDLSGYEKIEM